MQKSAIREILTNVKSPDIFINTSQEHRDFKDYIIIWEQKYKDFFSNIEDVQFAVLRKDRNLSGLRVLGQDCNCANSSVIISDCEDDEICLIPPSPGCITTTEQDEDGGNCGFWWLMPCDKLCK